MCVIPSFISKVPTQLPIIKDRASFAVSSGLRPIPITLDRISFGGFLNSAQQCLGLSNINAILPQAA